MASIFFLGSCYTIFAVVVSVLLAILTSRERIKLPPGRTGWPIIGETLDFMSSPEKFVHTRMAKYSSDIFKTSLAGEKTAILCGPAGNKFLFSNEANVTPWLPQTMVKALSLQKVDPTSRSFNILSEQLIKFFRLESVQQYVATVDLKAREHMETHWVPYKEVKAQTLCKDFTFILGCKLFINFSKLDEIRELAEAYCTLLEGTVSVPLNVPGTHFHRAMKAANVVRQKLLNIVRQKKIELVEKGNQVNIDGLDLLGRLLVATDQKGMVFDEEQITGFIIGVLFASFSPTSATITFALHHLAKYPEVYSKVLQEQLEIVKTKGKGELLTWNDIQKMKYTWNVVCESMRLIPPSLGGYRNATTDISYAGYTVPKGWKVLWTVHTIHKDPKIFPNPEKFDPSRFDKRLPPNVFQPFGGGPHMCSGKEYARVVVLVFLHNVVTRFKLRKVNPNERITYSSEPLAVEGLKICLQRHQDK